MVLQGSSEQEKNTYKRLPGFRVSPVTKRSKVFPDKSFQFMGGKYSRLPPSDLSVFKNNQRRHTTYLVCCSYLRIFVDIDLDNSCRVSYAILELLKCRGLHFTRAAPLGKKIDQYRLVLVYDLIKLHNIQNIFVLLKVTEFFMLF